MKKVCRIRLFFPLFPLISLLYFLLFLGKSPVLFAQDASSGELSSLEVSREFYKVFDQESDQHSKAQNTTDSFLLDSRDKESPEASREGDFDSLWDASFLRLMDFLETDEDPTADVFEKNKNKTQKKNQKISGFSLENLESVFNDQRSIARFYISGIVERRRGMFLFENDFVFEWIYPSWALSSYFGIGIPVSEGIFISVLSGLSARFLGAVFFVEYMINFPIGRIDLDSRFFFQFFSFPEVFEQVFMIGGFYDFLNLRFRAYLLYQIGNLQKLPERLDFEYLEAHVSLRARVLNHESSFVDLYGWFAHRWYPQDGSHRSYLGLRTPAQVIINRYFSWDGAFLFFYLFGKAGEYRISDYHELGGFILPKTLSSLNARLMVGLKTQLKFFFLAHFQEKWWNQFYLLVYGDWMLGVGDIQNFSSLKNTFSITGGIGYRWNNVNLSFVSGYRYSTGVVFYVLADSFF